MKVLKNQGQVLQLINSLEIVERGASDCMVKAAFEWGERWANISMDAPHTALWDILRQIPELR